MAYPRTKIEIIDKSQPTPRDINNVRSPVAMQAASADKGTEDLQLFHGEEWFKMFGYEQNFKKHGQALKQTGELITAGADVYFKRIVAPDAKLPNLGVYVQIQKFQEQKKDDNGNLLYLDENGEETTESTHTVITGTGQNPTGGIPTNPPAIPGFDNEDENPEAGAGEGSATGDGPSLDDEDEPATYTNEPVMITRVNIKWNSLALDTTSNDMQAIANSFATMVPTSSANNIVLPLFIIGAAGRGTYAPRVRITPDYRFSRGLGYAYYKYEVIEDGDISESVYFSAYPDRIEKEKNVFIDMAVPRKSKSTRLVAFEDNWFTMYHTMEQMLGLAEDSLRDVDFLFGNTVKGVALENITCDVTAFNPQNLYGNILLNGDNGSFGETPMASEDYEKELIKVFNGTYSEEIYNLDATSLDFILDADYPESVKRAIEQFVTFREDAFFLRDMGTYATTIDEFEIIDYFALHNRYSSSYCNFMKTIDDDTKKYITVTITYLLAPLLVTHFVNGCSRPFAGEKYGVWFDYGEQVVKNSINFLPKVTPSLDEKLRLEDLGINYVCIYEGKKVVVETVWTAQHVELQTELSFSCNVWSIQQVIKLLRRECPKNRYSFLNGNDFDEYQQELTRKLNDLSSNFLEFGIEYQYDEAYEVQKIYYAVLTVKFRGFIMAEYFKIVALPTY